MNHARRSQWTFEPRRRAGFQADGDFGKSFSDFVVKAPGFLSQDKPSDYATILAREVTQNAWDSALERRAASLPCDAPPPDPDFVLTYKFTKLKGTKKTELVSALGLEELSSQLSRIDAADGESQRTTVGLEDQDCLVDLANPDVPLRILEVHEAGTLGMYEDPSEETSKLLDAMCGLGITNKPNDSGGSWGYGKAGFILASRTRTVVAYTCFLEPTSAASPSQPTTIRQLLGCAYWGGHKCAGTSYAGGAFFADTADVSSEPPPFRGTAADSIATALGLDPRDGPAPHSLGTTLLILDPTVTAHDLAAAIEQNWWPALHTAGLGFHVRIFDYGDHQNEVQIRPLGQKQTLRPFVTTYMDASGHGSDKGPNPKRSSVSQPKGSGTAPYAGHLALTADLNGWSRPSSPDQATSDKSLVALVRETRMVIEYLECGDTPPWVRGTFVAHPENNKFLRLTEPRGHDKWKSKVTSPKPDAKTGASIAGHIVQQVKSKATKFQRSLTEDVNADFQLELPFMAKQFSKLNLGIKKGTKRKVKTEPSFLHTTVTSVEPYMHDGQAVGDVEVRYNYNNPNLPPPPHEMTIEIQVWHQWKGTDNRRGEEGLVVHVTPPPGFANVLTSETAEGEAARVQLRGPLHGREPVTLRFWTEATQHSWDGRVKAVAQIVEGAPVLESEATR